MTGTTFKRMLKSGTSWGFIFEAGTDESGKRNQIYKSGFATKSAADTAKRNAIADYIGTHGQVLKHRGLLGAITWGYEIGEG
jgi:hypothetical protein